MDSGDTELQVAVGPAETVLLHWGIGGTSQTG